MILAGIDIGTNTLRLLIADTNGSSLRELHGDRRITRLGRGLDRSGALSLDAREASLAVLSEFAAEVKRRGAEAVSAVGTSALRNARNAGEFIADVRGRTGIAVDVISGEEEARLTLLGVAAAVRRPGGGDGGPGPALVVDIGGGSTEVIFARGTAHPGIVSLHLGAVYLTERFIHKDPPAQAEVAELRSAVRAELAKAGDILAAEPDHRPEQCIGTAGTITTLAAVDQALDNYDPEKINGYILSASSISRIVGRLAIMTLAGRRAITGLEKGREDIILSGAIVAQEIMDHWGYDRMLVSDWGLREGTVLDLYGKLRRGHTAKGVEQRV
jgi:exopolyphosphatase/guanosine-5'-triphosphate,3'-diphosphate pyrophosphatase